ncbi:MAG: NADH-ubiquinone oxidoreductase-F iron-sulfur binding region domain-containing protein, partial [Eubacteriales bacterium]
CPVEVTSELLARAYSESCGKCTFCREGLNQLSLMVKDIAEGKGKAGYIDIIYEIASAMKGGTLCSLGQNCGEIAIGLLNHQGQEVIKHIKRKKCTAGVCFSNETYYVDPFACTGCGDCVAVCPENAIDGINGYIHMIDELDCSRCGKCTDACTAGAVRVTISRTPRIPDRLTRVGHFKRF